jgi:small subunit ribosomal protein S20
MAVEPTVEHDVGSLTNSTIDQTRKGFSHMANIKSQKKRILTNAKRHERNKSVKAEVKTRTKVATDTIGTDDNDEAVRLAVKRIDKAASKGVMHKNAAARKKSRLMKKVNASA